MSEAPVVSVVVPTHERREALGRLLASLADQSAAPQSYEVVVAVDGSTDGTLEMLAGHSGPFELNVVEGPRRGRAGACNAALERARGEIAIVLDDDMEAVPEFIERHRAHHPPGSRLCVLGAVPVRLGPDSPHAARYVAAKFGDHLANIAAPGHRFVPRDFYSGNASLRTEVVREVGGFDESFAVYGNEDVELSLRLAAAGVEVRYDPAARADQEYGKDLAGLGRDTLEKGRTAVLLARLHPAAFSSLRLADPDDASRPWRVTRAVLLAITRWQPRTTVPAIAAGGLLERLGLWRQPLFYRRLLDYLFWAGVGTALGESTDEGELAQLAAELRRGPIDLLLHG